MIVLTFMQCIWAVVIIFIIALLIDLWLIHKFKKKKC
nr:MAG TPA: Rifin [Crassvirales sp.]